MVFSKLFTYLYLFNRHKIMRKYCLGLLLSSVLQFVVAAEAKPDWLSPLTEPGRSQHQQLLQQQAQKNASQAARLSGPRLWYAGFGLHSDSIAYRSDVLLTQKRLQELFPDLIAYTFDNQKQEQQLQAPFASFGSFDHTIGQLASLMRKEDVLVVLLTDHGNQGFVSVNIAGTGFGVVIADHVNTALRRIPAERQLIIVSACHSGSFIESLKHPKRVILTASAADKVSYGCQPLANNTFFIDALFADKIDGDSSLSQRLDQAKEKITARETELKFAASLPQVYVGEKMQDFFKQSWASWLQAK